MTRKVEISSKTIVFTVFFILSLWLLFQVRSIIIMLFISFILMTAINPLVKLAKKIKIPTIITVLVVYIAILGLLITTVASLIPAVIEQSKGLIDQLPSFVSEVENRYSLQIDGNFFSNHFSAVPSNVLKIAVGAFSNILNILAVFFVTYYLILEREEMHTYFIGFFGNNNAEKKAEKFVEDLEKNVGGWIRGQLVLMIFIGLSTYIGFTLLGLPYALPLAIIAGLLEIIPNMGPTIAAVPAILIGLTISPAKAIGVTAFAILIQQLEINLIVPFIMKKAIGTRPLVTILALFTGYTLAGITGAILAMPIYLVIRTSIEHLN